jgi:hypothetical protein
MVTSESDEVLAKHRALAKLAAMRRHLVVLLAVMFALSPLEGVAGEKQILDAKELAGSWHDWITRDEGQDRATLSVSADGSYRALTTRGAITEGKFYLKDGNLRYRSSRTTGRRVSPKIRARPR